MIGAVTMKDVLKRLIIRTIEQCDDPVERKERIIIAHGDGHLTDREATDLINILGLKAA